MVILRKETLPVSFLSGAVGGAEPSAKRRLLLSSGAATHAGAQNTEEEK